MTMRRNLTRAMLAALALFMAPAAYADGPGDAGPDTAAAPTTPSASQPVGEPASAPEGRSGVIPLGEDVTLNVPQGYRYYSAAEAQSYLQRNNAAAPNGAVLGMIARADADIRAPGTWATIVSYDAIGYVQSETAPGLNDANFETQVREARTNQSRAFEGFIANPAFDAAAPNVAWAERTAAPGAGGKDLRYEQKKLGRYGVAALTSIGSADQMDEITAAADDLQAMLSFPEGRRHVDFLAANDQVSAYSVPGLVTGVPTAAQALAETASTTQSQTNFGGLAGWFPWIAFGVIGLAVIGYMFMRNRKNEDDDAEAEHA
jgi:uncharacterized membrane-anchored protein